MPCMVRMAWDPALLRKYTTTSHLRLLNQVRSELRDQPIQRPLVTSRAAAAAAGASRRAARPAEASTAAGRGGFRRRSSDTAVAAPVSTAAELLRHELQQPIVAVPVITDLVLPDSHPGV